MRNMFVMPYVNIKFINTFNIENVTDINLIFGSSKFKGGPNLNLYNFNIKNIKIISICSLI